MDDDATNILARIESGDSSAADNLLPLVYSELRRLATAKLANEYPGQTLQPTALVHEAYLRLVDVDKVQHWDSRGHFFAAAAESMRRILVERARQRKSLKRGGNHVRTELADIDVELDGDRADVIDLIALDEALRELEERDPTKAELVKLRFFAGLTIPQAAKAMGIGSSTADKYWAYAKCWLRVEMDGKE